MRPWYKKKRYILGGILLIIIIAGVASAGGGDDDGNDTASDDRGVESVSGNEENPPQNDVEVSECATDDLGYMEAKLQITNNSSGRSNYIIEVTFESEDGNEQFDTATVFVNNLEAGQTKSETAGTFTEAAGSFNCRLTEVDRFAS